ncbi:molybdopterin cofactor-binding domain-containing protein [Streptomyces sp. NPDC057579]|uniref:molybdopterin cofactor-binding domain-containing protein n=1 Tax=Streptomyces sp. NPDC057579 TaxID=3346172 RepID=UPI00368640E6
MSTTPRATPPTGTPWSSKKLREAYEEGARFGWWDRPKGGTRDGHWLIGCGMADCTQGQFRFTSHARVRLRADCTATVEAGYTDIGAGSTTIFPQIAAQTLGIDISSVKGISGDTDLPYAGPAYGSGTTIAMGTAVHLAANDVLRQLADVLAWPADEVRGDSGALTWHDRRRSYADILRAAERDEVVGNGEMVLPGGASAASSDPSAGRSSPHSVKGARTAAAWSCRARAEVSRRWRAVPSGRRGTAALPRRGCVLRPVRGRSFGLRRRGRGAGCG